MNNKFKINRTNLPLWRGIALVAGIFSFIICMLVLVNYIQINRVDPVNTEIINSLVDRLNENPNDEQLREQIREMDLLVRKAYFTNQWQVKAGGYLLLFGVIVMAIALHLFYSGKKELPKVTEEEEENIILFREKARKWIVIGGFGMVGITLVFAFLTHQELGNQFTVAAKTAKAEAEQEQTQQVSEVIEVSAEVIPEKKEEVKEEEVEVIVEKAPEEVAVEVQEEPKEVVPAKTVGKYTGTYPTKEMMANFPSFRGPGGNGIAYQKNIPNEWDGASGKNVLWKQPVPIHAYNSPVIWGNKLFLSGANATSREIYCYDRNNGKLLWTAKVEQIPGSPATSPDVTPDTGHAASTVTTDGKSVFAIFANGDVISVDMNGEKQWAKNLGVPDNHYGHSSSLLIFEDKLIVQYDQKKSGMVLALSTKDGSELWNTPRKVRVSWASPVIVNNNGQIEVLLAADPSVASYDVNTGKELWHLDCITGEVGPSVAFANGIVYALNEYASLVAIKTGEKPEVLWEAYDYLSDVPSPIAYKDMLFIVTSYGAVACYNATSGEILWEQEFDNGFYSSPILVDGKIYLLDREGVMHIFKADKQYASVATSSLGEKSDTSPAFADGRVYIRGEKNLYCIGK
ncbi:PQQ-binding-like beta-propeller repeat protein [Labilibaculum sp. DW002]|uniref:PQQ-binding-like beta-propeller repeat protein n=1 Tax=Paralabilibaculum antarcticum TaxID=2912572 RepID=A0ABT5VM06_9BACT|nr:PQQ-binding-like beta-propeller repeat protein [Labilibaculum sp. DW002]MDE5416468.1 PQQ-binding-like beta-propeller repeat protein [Labilibaculum sp. DW002]